MSLFINNIGIETNEKLHLTKDKQYKIEKNNDDINTIIYIKDQTTEFNIYGNINKNNMKNILKSTDGTTPLYYHHICELNNNTYIYWFYDQIRKKIIIIFQLKYNYNFFLLSIFFNVPFFLLGSYLSPYNILHSSFVLT
jgi:hypothetical protein